MVGTGSDHQAVGIEGNPAGVSDQLKSLQINNKQQHDDHVSSHDSNGTPISLSPPEKKDDDSEQGDESATNESQETAKKKKKNKSKKKKEPLQQTDPPSIPVLELFPSGDFPEGESQECKDNNLWRTTSEEKRELERLEKPIYNVVRQAAEVHRQVRKYMGSIIKPGILMIDMCETLENTVRKLISENGLQAGIAFLQGLSRLKN